MYYLWIHLSAHHHCVLTWQVSPKVHWVDSGMGKSTNTNREVNPREQEGGTTHTESGEMSGEHGIQEGSVT